MSISMSCINRYPPLSSANSQFKHKHKLQTNNQLFCLSKPTRVLSLHNTPTVALLRPLAIADNSLLLGLTSPAKSGDISVFLQTSAVMLLLYLITNFLVPNIISKSLEFDEEKEDSNPKV